MALPMMSTPTYTLTVPSTEKKIKFRPFVVKEQKALLLAQQSEDTTVMVESLKNVIQSCVMDKIDVDDLATFDLEYIFTQIRAKSVGELVELFFTCDEPSCVDNEKARLKIGIDLTSIEIERSTEHTKKIELFGDVGVIMKYPNMDTVKKLQVAGEEENLDQVFEVMANSIDYIYQGDELFHAKEQKPQEILDFLYNLTSEQFLKVQNFFVTMPKMVKRIEYDCPVCSKHHKTSLEGLQSFF